MDQKLQQKAISLSLNAQWDEAISINLILLKKSPNDSDTLNRLSRAYYETNQIKKAVFCAKKVLKVDPYNQIALKSLDKYKKAKNKNSVSILGINDPSIFLEEPGKTKIATLVNTGDAKVLTNLTAGSEIKLTTHAHRVCVTTIGGKYIGRLPDDIAARLRILVKGGNKYNVFIKSIEKKQIKIFIREVFKSEEFINTTSFPSEKIDYIPYAPPELVNKDRPEMENIDSESF